MGKRKTSDAGSDTETTPKKTKTEDYSAEQISAVNALAHPLADKKTTKHVLRLVKKASKSRKLRRGVKEVVKMVRKGEKGLIVLAADITPVDIISHLPVLAEDAKCPYVWVPAKETLGVASSTKRPTSCVLVSKTAHVKKGEEAPAPDGEYDETYDVVVKEVEAL